jgi:cathepsin L
VPPTLDAIAPYIEQFDWEEFLPLYVGDQGDCNSCWAFATIGAFDSSVQLQNLKARYALIKTDPTTGQTTVSDLPPYLRVPKAYWVQDLINCIGKKKADCIAGGWHGTAFDFMVTRGLLETNNGQVYYIGQAGPCAAASGPKARAAAWGYVAYPPKNPTVLQIKQALLEHGPVVATVRVDADKKFQSYQGGLFNEHDPYAVNHAVQIVGWDDTQKAWRIQNSWSTEWGEQGFMWIAYDSNSIGQYAAWVEAPVSIDGLLGVRAIGLSDCSRRGANNHKNMSHELLLSKAH